MAALNTARVIGKLQNKSDWKQLLNGQVDAICLKGFATPEECNELVTFVINHPKTTNYSTAAGIRRLGSSFNDIRKKGNIALEYSEPDILEEALAVNSVVSRIFGTIAASWPCGIETFSYQGLPLHRAIARRIVGGSVEPHDDNISKELIGDSLASTIQAQMGLNLYLEIPPVGGELEGWHRRLSPEEYESLRNPDPQLHYGIRREAIGDSDWKIKPALGELVIFQNFELHAICGSEKPRATWGCFLGYRSDKHPLLVWS